MCEGKLHPGLTWDPRLSRRTFLAAASAGSAVAVAGSAWAEEPVTERDVNIHTPDGTADAALFYPSGKGRWPAVVIWTDVLGLRPIYRDMGRRLASQGYVVLVPNFYYRVKKAPIVDGPFDFGNPADFDKIAYLDSAVTAKGIDIDSHAFMTFLDALPQTDTKAKAGVQGYCMGGWMVFHTAALFPDRIGAAAVFHGGGLATDKPSSPHLLIPQMKVHAYIGIATNDDRHEPTAKEILKSSFAAATEPAKIEVYAKANHGFCIRGVNTYNEQAAERAWAELSALYKEVLV